MLPEHMGLCLLTHSMPHAYSGMLNVEQLSCRCRHVSELATECKVCMTTAHTMTANATARPTQRAASLTAAAVVIVPIKLAGSATGKSVMAMGRRRAMGALMGVVRVPPGCSRSASSMRRASKAHAANVAVVATCKATTLLGHTTGRKQANGLRMFPIVTWYVNGYKNSYIAALHACTLADQH